MNKDQTTIVEASGGYKANNILNSVELSTLKIEEENSSKGERCINDPFDGLISIRELSDYILPLDNVAWDYVIKITSHDIAYRGGRSYIIDLVKEICESYSHPDNRDQYILPLLSNSSTHDFQAIILVSYLPIGSDEDPECQLMKIHHSFNYYFGEFNVRVYGNDLTAPISYIDTGNLIQETLSEREYYLIPEGYSIHYKNFDSLLNSPLYS